MSDSTSQFEASIVAGIETPGSQEAARIFTTLLKLVEQLEGSAKETGKQLVAAFEAGEKPEQLTSKIRILQRELRFLSTTGKGTELFKNDQVDVVNKIQKAINEAAKAYDAMRQSQQLARYELGLDSKTTLEAANSMKVLEKNLKAVDLALKNDSGNKALQEKRKLLADNKELLEIVTRDLQQQTRAEDLQEQIAKRNFEASRARYTEVQRLTRQRRESEGSAKDQRRTDESNFDYTQDARDFASLQSNLKFTRVRNALAPGQEAAAFQRLQDSQRNDYLKQVYQDAGIKPASLTATLQDGARVRAMMAEIRDIEAQLVAARAKGNVDLQKEAALLDDIRVRMQKVEHARADTKLNDPENAQANRDRQARNMLNRASGEGGAALLAVQASLMANYSILTSAVGAMRSAVSTSVELEASFRNVQAVTATSGSEMAGLEERIKAVAAASRFTSLEVSQAALTLGQAGLSAKQVGEALGPVVMLANAAGTSIAQAVDLVTSVIGVFDKTTADVGDIANKVTQAANSSKLSVEKMALALQYSGNVASKAGISFEEVTAALAAMSNAGIKNGSTLGTGLRQFLVEVEKPSKEFISTLHRIGLGLSDVDFKANGLLGVTRKLREAGFVASDALKSFDVRGAAAFNALIANPEELERQYRLLLDTKAGVEANEIQMDSLKAQSARLTTSMGNLASSGFEPVSHLLARLLGGFATLTQAISEHNVAVGIAGTALTALAAAGATSYLASMAAGALKLAGAATESSAALRLLQNAGAAGSMANLLSGISSAVGGLGRLTTVAGTATTAAGTLAGAIGAVRTAFMGMSIITGIGLAIAAITAAMYAYEYVTSRAAAEIDKLKGSVNSAKGAFEEKDQAVKSLTDKINDLTYRQATLRGNTEALKTESLALTSQFGAIGYQADQNNSSFDTMISKLRALRMEMQQIRKQSLETALAENRTLLEKQTDKARDDLKALAGTGGWTRDFAKDLGGVVSTIGSRLSQAERDKVIAAQNEIRTGDVSKMADVGGATLIVQRLAAELRGEGKTDPNYLRKLDTLTEQLVKVGKSFSDMGATRADIARQEATLRQDEAYKKFNESGRFGSRDGKNITFEDSLPAVGNLEMFVRKNGIKETDNNPMAVFDAIKFEQERRQATYQERLKQIKQAELANEITPETAATFKQILNARVEKDRNEMLEAAKATDPEAKLTYGRQKRLLEAQLKGAKENKNKSEEERIQRALGELEISFQNRSQTDEFLAKETEEQIHAITDQNVKNIRDRKGRDSNLNIQERSLRLQAEASDRRAEELKASTKTVGSLDELNKILDEAVAAKVDAKNKRVEALLKKQQEDNQKEPLTSETKLAQKLEMQALIEGENSKINTFASNFVGLIEAAMARLDKLNRTILDQKEKIAETKIEGEDRVFESQQALRDIDLQLALGKKIPLGVKNRTQLGDTVFGPKGVAVNLKSDGNSARTIADLDRGAVTSDGVSGAIRETLGRRRARLALEAAKIELEENEKLLEQYGDATKGMIGDMTAAYQQAKASVQKIREALATATGDEKITLTAALEAAQKKESETFRDLRQAHTEQKTLRKDNTDIQLKIAQNSENLPQEVTLDNLLNKLDEVWAKYKETVGNMDVVKTLGDGLTAVLGSVTGGLASALTSIVTHTKSVKDAFKDMAAGVIKAMIDILAQMIAMQAVKGVLSFFGVETGGLITPNGPQVKGMAYGGPVIGGVPGKDSVPTMLMPGEFVMRKAAVDIIGTDHLHSLNSMTNSVVSSNTAKAPSSANNKQDTAPVNVWVVTPDQKQSLGAKDVEVIVADNINRGGSIKQLIKQVNRNEV